MADDFIGRICAEPDGNFILSQDVTLTRPSSLGDFSGVLDCAGHTVTLQIDTVDDAAACGGMFGALTGVLRNATIRVERFNITVQDVLGDRFVGLVAGKFGGIIENVRVDVVSEASVAYTHTSRRGDLDIYFGGLAGAAEGGARASNCIIQNTGGIELSARCKITVMTNTQISLYAAGAFGIASDAAAEYIQLRGEGGVRVVSDVSGSRAKSGCAAALSARVGNFTARGIYSAIDAITSDGNFGASETYALAPDDASISGVYRPSGQSDTLWGAAGGATTYAPTQLDFNGFADGGAVFYLRHDAAPEGMLPWAVTCDGEQDVCPAALSSADAKICTALSDKEYAVGEEDAIISVDFVGFGGTFDLGKEYEREGESYVRRFDYCGSVPTVKLRMSDGGGGEGFYTCIEEDAAGISRFDFDHKRLVDGKYILSEGNAYAAADGFNPQRSVLLIANAAVTVTLSDMALPFGEELPPPEFVSTAEGVTLVSYSAKGDDGEEYTVNSPAGSVFIITAEFVGCDGIIIVIPARLTVERRKIIVRVGAVGNREYNARKADASSASIDVEGEWHDSRIEVSAYVENAAADVGKYAVSAHVKYNGASSSNYDVEVVETIFDITPRRVTVRASNVQSVYGDCPEFGIEDDGGFLGEDKLKCRASFIGEYDGVGEYVVRPIFGDDLSNYAIETIDGRWSVSPRAVYASPKETSREYDGVAFVPEISLTGVLDGDNVELVLSYDDFLQAPHDVGKYVLDIDCADKNYFIFACESVVIEITPRVLQVRVDVVDREYDGRPFEARAEITSAVREGDLPRADIVYLDADGNVIASPSDSGEYGVRVQIVDDANYICAPEVSKFRITPQKITVRAVGKEKTYDGERIAIGEDAYVCDAVPADALKFKSTLAFGGIHVGEYPVTVEVEYDGAEAKNYELTFVSAAYRIVPRAVSVVAVSVEIAYEEGASDFEFTVSGGGFLTEDSVEYGVEAMFPDGIFAAGEYILRPYVNLPEECADDYDVCIFEGKVTVLYGVINAKTVSYGVTFDGETHGARITGIDESSPIQVLYNGNFDLPRAAGEYTVTLFCTDKNYVLNYVPATIEIDKAVADFVLSPPVAATYDNTLKKVSWDVAAPTCVEPVIEYENEKGAKVDGVVRSGKYIARVVGISDVENYRYIDTYCEFTISRAKVTLRAQGGTKVYDGLPVAVSADAFTCEGMFFDSGIHVSVDVPNAGADAAEYLVRVSVEMPSACADNYDVTLHEGVLEVLPAEVKVTFEVCTGEFDGNPRVAVATADGLVSSDIVETLYNGKAEAPRDAGLYRLSVRIPRNAHNYVVECEEKAFYITRANVTVTMKGGMKVYDGAVPSVNKVDYYCEGTAAELLGIAARIKDAQSDAGVYIVTADVDYRGLGKDNFNVDIINAAYTVSKASQTIDSDALAWEFGAADVDVTYVYGEVEVSLDGVNWNLERLAGLSAFTQYTAYCRCKGDGNHTASDAVAVQFRTRADASYVNDRLSSLTAGASEETYADVIKIFYTLTENEKAKVDKKLLFTVVSMHKEQAQQESVSADDLTVPIVCGAVGVALAVLCVVFICKRRKKL